MSKLLVDVRLPDLHPSQQVPALPDTDRLHFVDRVSLRLGLWLLLRSTAGAERRADRAARSLVLENHRALGARDHEALRRLLLGQPRV